jgi:hypothetical protein
LEVRSYSLRTFRYRAKLSRTLPKELVTSSQKTWEVIMYCNVVLDVVAIMVRKMLEKIVVVCPRLKVVLAWEG